MTPLHDSARKALTAVLAAQGLRPTTVGGHRVVIEAIHRQGDPDLLPLLVTVERMRRQRNAVEYPSIDATIPIRSEDVEDLIPVTLQLITVALRIVRETARSS